MALAAVVALSAAGQAGAAQLITNGSFEAVNIGTGHYGYPGHPEYVMYGASDLGGQVHGGWTYTNSALVNASGSNAWYGSTPPVGFDGQQFVALQSTGSISQSFTATASTLYLTWQEAARPYMGDQSYQVQLGSTVVGGGYSTQSGDPFGLQSLTLNGLTVGQSYDLTFKGLVGSDQSAFLDKVSLTDVAPPPPPPGIVKTLYVGDAPLPAGQTMIEDFDHPIAPGFTFTGGWVRSGLEGLASGQSAPPPGDLTNYVTMMNGQFSTLETTGGGLLSSLSFYMGSPDTFNKVQFFGPDGYSQTLSGYDIWLPAGGGGTGDQTWGRRINYDFGGAFVNKVVFSSTGNSFELDSIAGRLGGAAVPEPATWALMIGGFGLMGAHLRRRRTVLARVKA